MCETGVICCQNSDIADADIPAKPQTSMAEKRLRLFEDQDCHVPSEAGGIWAARGGSASQLLS